MNRAFLMLSMIVTIMITVHSPLSAQAINKGQATIGESGLSIPRFVSVDTDKVNMRTGPGEQYPILWVYQRNHLPLVVTSEYGQWRRVRDFEGTTGWMHRALLSGNRTAVITGKQVRTLYSDPNTKSTPVIRAKPGVVAPINQCAKGWCNLTIAGRSGWLPEGHIWGIFSGELIEE